MDREALLDLVRSTRARHGRVTGAALRQEALDGVLAGELIAEQAGSLGRLGRRLDGALLRLVELEEQAASTSGPTRQAVVREHARVRGELQEARWEMKVVREAIGLRGVRRELDRFWPVPPPLR